MYFRYGNYSHDPGEGHLQIMAPQTTFSSAGLVTGVKYQWEWQGRKQAATVAELTAKLLEMEAAYAVQGLDAGLYEDSGTPTAHVLHANLCFGGVRVTQPPFYPIGDQAQYNSDSPFRDYAIGLEAEVTAGAPLQIYDWKEEISYSGGGPDFVLVTCLTGPPQPQLANQHTPYRASQAGEAASNIWWPNPGQPKWPNCLHSQQSTIRYQPATRAGAAATNGSFRYRTSWNYVFESATELSGYPSTF